MARSLDRSQQPKLGRAVAYRPRPFPMHSIRKEQTSTSSCGVMRSELRGSAGATHVPSVRTAVVVAWPAVDEVICPAHVAGVEEVASLFPPE